MNCKIWEGRRGIVVFFLPSNPMTFAPQQFVFIRGPVFPDQEPRTPAKAPRPPQDSNQQGLLVYILRPSP
jgi:hypothetical protein